MADTMTLRNLSEFNEMPAVGGDEIESELLGANARAARRFHHAYWRRPDGYICIAPYFGDDMTLQIERGMVALRQYGTFQLHTPQWDAVREPWRLILAKKGAKEFPIEQVLEHGWHRTPPYGDVEFPQLADLEVEEHKCTMCQKVFLTPEHLGKHQSIAHKDISHEQSLGRALAKALDEAQKSNNSALAEALTVLGQQFGKQNEQMLALLKQAGGAK